MNFIYFHIYLLQCQQPEDDDSEPKIVKFKLKKCIVYILLAKQEPVKMTRILRKVRRWQSDYETDKIYKPWYMKHNENR